MNNVPNQSSDSQIIELIFKDAQESIQALDDTINRLNTQLSAIAGLSAALIKFANDLPDQSAIFSGFSCYSCSIFKIFTILLLLASTFISFWGLLPKDADESNIISPLEQINQFITLPQVKLSQDQYKLWFISQYDVEIDGLVNTRSWKAKRLQWSAKTFVVAALLASLDLVLSTSLKS